MKFYGVTIQIKPLWHYFAQCCLFLGILEKKNLKFFSEFYLWLLAEILSKFKVILNVIFR